MLNLAFVIGFPLAFVGRIEGGFPEFVYGVPLAAGVLLPIPLLTACMGVALLAAMVTRSPDQKSSPPAIRDGLVVAGLLSFTWFAGYWNLLIPIQGL